MISDVSCTKHSKITESVIFIHRMSEKIPERDFFAALDELSDVEDLEDSGEEWVNDKGESSSSSSDESADEQSDQVADVSTRGEFYSYFRNKTIVGRKIGKLKLKSYFYLQAMMMAMNLTRS